MRQTYVSHGKSFFEVAKGLFNKLLETVDTKCFYRIPDSIAHKSEVTIVLFHLADNVLLETIVYTSCRCLVYFKVLLIELFISRIRSDDCQVIFKTIMHGIETCLVLSCFLVIVVEVEIYTFLVLIRSPVWGLSSV